MPIFVAITTQSLHRSSILYYLSFLLLLRTGDHVKVFNWFEPMRRGGGGGGG